MVGRVIQFSYLQGNKRERQYSANYVDLSKDTLRTQTFVGFNFRGWDLVEHFAGINFRGERG